MKVRIVIALVIAITAYIKSGAQEYDTSYFISPVKHKIRLSGSFAELRTSHFHMGIDIKSSNGRIGDPIVAIADGFVSRIKVDASGYGNALYIDHPNGYTSVYAHMNSYNDTITKFVEKYQYETKSFEQDIYPDSTQFILNQGDLIGKMGNSGKSFGPHLHFEIRDTKSEIPVNPFLFGIKPEDKRAPNIERIKVAFYDDEKTKLSESELTAYAISNNEYSLKEDTITVNGNYASISSLIYDRMDGASNKNGVYLMKMLANDKVVFGYRMNKVGYDETHMIDAFIDYAEKQKTKRTFSKCYSSPHNTLSVYAHDKLREGIIYIEPDSVVHIKLILQDYHKNESSLQFYLKGATYKKDKVLQSRHYSMIPGQKNLIRLAHGDILFDNSAFIDTTDLKISEFFEYRDSIPTYNYRIGDRSTPIFGGYELHLDKIVLDSIWKSKLGISYCDDPESPSIYKGKWKGDKYVIRLNRLGSLSTILDTIAPTIKMSSKSKEYISFKITDNFEAGTKAQRLKYNANIDGQWVLFRYDLKNDLIRYDFDEKYLEGKHILNIDVYDAVGNHSTHLYNISN